MTITASPLAWPPGWKRMEPHRRVDGPFRVGERGSMTISVATSRLRNELRRFGIREADIIISTNLRLRLDGFPYSDQRAPQDPGAAAYWEDPFNKQPRCMAIDRYTKVEQNIAALAATIEAMRAIERHGGAVVLERAFTGFTALPPPIVAGMHRHWRDVLGFAKDARLSVDDIRSRYRSLASEHHPDKGGTGTAMTELNQARDAALKERS